MSFQPPHDKLRLAELIAGRGHLDQKALRNEQRARWARAVAESLCRWPATRKMYRWKAPASG